jgi:LuxR family transcriptional regulator, maltose regulon positive regulatory protein
MDGKALSKPSRSRRRVPATVAQPVSLAKISPPRIRNVVLRPRLFDLVDSFGDCPITWISAPAGSGKTTLVASYLSKKKLESLWYQIDERDTDQATFFYYMGLAAAKAAPRVRRPLPLLTSVYALGIPAFTSRFFEDLYNRLKPPFCVVFDNYQLVPSESPFHERICQGLEIAPEGVRVIILSRTRPPPQFARLRANELVSLVERDTINFTLPEARDFMLMRNLRAIPDELIGQLHEKTNGWAAGLALITESIKSGSIQGSLPIFPPQEVFHYFAREIFSKMDEETRACLMKTALLPKMTGVMAVQLTGTTRATEIIDQLYRDNFFTQRDNQPDPSYQYHPLFREFLLSQARDCLPEGEMGRLLKAGAKILEEAGQIEDAVDLLLSASAWEDLPALLLHRGPYLLGQGREMVLEAWLDWVPKDVVRASPWLLYWRGLNRVMNKPAEAKGFLETAFIMFEASGDRLGSTLACGGLVKALFNGSDDWVNLEEWLDRYQCLLTHNPIPLSPVLDGMLSEEILFAFMWCFPYRTAEVEYWLERGLRNVRKIGDADRELLLLSHAVEYYSDHRQQFEKALFYCSKGDEIARRAHSPVSILRWKVADMLRASILGAHGEEISCHVRDILEYCHKRGIHGDGYILLLAVVHQFRANDLDGVAQLLPQAAQAADTERGRTDVNYQTLRGWYYFNRGDLSRATGIIKAMPEPSEKWGMWLRLMVFRRQSLILWANGDRDEALRVFALHKELAARFNPLSVYRSSCNLCEAYMFLDSGNDEEGLYYLNEALVVANQQGFDPTPNVLPTRVLTTLYTAALTHNIEVDYVRKLIRKRNLCPDEPPLDIPHWPWPIKVFTLGRFELLIDDKPIEMTRLKKKPLLLLKALIAHGGEGVHESYLSELLWPDADGDVAYGSFRTTLSRLRRILGNDESIIIHESMISLNRKIVWVDTWAFMRMCKEEEKKHDLPSDLFTKILDLYRGDFLPMEDEHWMVSYREKLRERFLRLIINVGRTLEERNKYEEAITCYRAAIDVDDLAEEMYLRLMVCYHALGDKTSAISVYERLHKILNARLNTTPSARTVAMYKQIKTAVQ